MHHRFLLDSPKTLLPPFPLSFSYTCYSAKLNGENITAKSLVLDVTSQESVDAAAKQFATEQGHLDVLVNNAGIASEAYNSDASKPDQDVCLTHSLPSPPLFIISFLFIVYLQVIRKTFETNFFGVIRVCAAFTPFVRKSSNPVILNISSSLGSLSMQSDPKNEQSKIQLPGIFHSHLKKRKRKKKEKRGKNIILNFHQGITLPRAL